MRSILENGLKLCSSHIGVSEIALSILLFLTAVELSFADTSRLIVPLQANVFEHIQFSKIKPDIYTFESGQLAIEVDDSASFLMLPFDRVRHVSDVRFKWQSRGVLRTIDAAHETRRNGDDAFCKLGLLLKTDVGWPNPFAPQWLKRVSKLLKFPSENMINLVAGAKHAAGERWVGPYNKRVTMLSVQSVTDKTGWQQASHHFDQPVDVVALWIMADGDDTHSGFTTRIRDIELD